MRFQKTLAALFMLSIECSIFLWKIVCLPKVIGVCSTLQGMKFKRLNSLSAQGDSEGDVVSFSYSPPLSKYVIHFPLPLH